MGNSSCVCQFKLCLAESWQKIKFLQQKKKYAMQENVLPIAKDLLWVDFVIKGHAQRLHSIN